MENNGILSHFMFQKNRTSDGRHVEPNHILLKSAHQQKVIRHIILPVTRNVLNT